MYKLLTHTHSNRKAYSVIYLNIYSPKIDRNIKEKTHKVKFKGYSIC